MTEHKEHLLARLDAIGEALHASGNALALLGLGSVGTELDRIDAYSDLDFFAIVKPGFKTAFIENLDWLEKPAPLAYSFKNTPDGYKALYADGIFCEFAVFEPDELRGIPFAAGRVVWKDDSFDGELLVPATRQRRTPDPEWLLGEALTNLYVGLGRFHRGERLSATRFIQGYAVDRVVELTKQWETAQPAHADQFGEERRYEFRYPDTAQRLASFMQGYERNLESARAILAFLKQHFEVNPALAAAIEGLLGKQA
jgi:hypothetical protein